MIALLNDTISLGKGCSQIPAFVVHPQPQVGANLLMNRGSLLLQSGHRVEERRQGFVVDLDALQGISRQVAIARHHDGHRLADIAYLTPH
jgi:hypothetical protein